MTNGPAYYRQERLYGRGLAANFRYVSFFMDPHILVSPDKKLHAFWSKATWPIIF
jgi:hypothetical protein